MKRIDFGNTEIERETRLSYQMLQSISSHPTEDGCELCPAFNPTNTDSLLANHNQQKTLIAITEQQQAQRGSPTIR